eukprot:TRINITY_DN33349_c0_g1_i2.p1 TRINITY_DN33349_c0_g1~~TRINITY_DN33349_c0_g1_i2.p1  ORF type:complete len:101 (+),score=13.87 TRINITY_DN33349_c0_g1_i2:172-474(+)
MAQTMGDEEAPFLESPSEMYPESPNQAARLERESNLGWSLGRLHSVMSLNTLEAINSYKGLNEDQEMNSEPPPPEIGRHTSELQSHSFISYAVFCLKKKK